MKDIRLAVIGCGQRGGWIAKYLLAQMDGIKITAACDIYSDRAENVANFVADKYGCQVLALTDYKEALKVCDAVYIATAWDSHTEIAIAAMNAGVAVALEVGGGYTIESLWEMVRTYERTKTPFMFMENCCFGKEELLATSLARHGLFGEVVHCHGSYAHYLAEEIAGGRINRHYRLENYLGRNCENYPTHELGPIAKLLGINRGNRMVSLVSVASRSAGMPEYINANADKYPDLVGKRFAQGDIVNTIITCAGGQTISLRLDTTLPRHYNREFTVRGTKGLYEQGCNMIYLQGEPEDFNTVNHYQKNINNAKRFEDQYLPEVWKEANSGIGHGGMDEIEFKIFADCLRDGREMPIDVYDAAAWMSVAPLSEASIASGNTVYFPDFTDGKWIKRPIEDVVPL